MPSNEERVPSEDDDGEVLPDEEAMIEERMDSLEDTDSHFTVEEAAAELGFDEE